jgi:hypothetical protein
MKKIFLLLIFGLLPCMAYSPGYNVLYIAEAMPICPYDKIISIITFIESSNNPLAYNKTEKAVGLFQIRPIRLRDYNEKANKNYTLKDCFDPIISKKIFLFYARKYEPTDFEGISHEWNGKYGKTDKYWKKVKKRLEKISH